MEAIVTSVDPIKFLCDCKTLKGQRLRGVTWLLSSRTDSFTPTSGDRVLITTATSYPLILGLIPAIGPSVDFSSQIGTTGPSTDQGSATGLSSGFQSNPYKPADFTAGDHIQTNLSGGLVGLLREGTALVRASPLAQIIVSRWDDLVRVVGRNYDLMCDFSSETIANIYGRLYRYYGFNRDLTGSKNSHFEYTEIHGDVAAGEHCKDAPFGTPKPIPSPISIVIKKRLIGAGSAGDVMVETLDESGEMIIVIGNSTQTANAGTIIDRVGTSTRTTVANQIQDIVSNSSVTINPSSISINFNDVSTAIFDSTGVRIESHSHYMRVDTSGVHFG